MSEVHQWSSRQCANKDCSGKKETNRKFSIVYQKDIARMCLDDYCVDCEVDRIGEVTYQSTLNEFEKLNQKYLTGKL